jgi:hypothetical protein
MWRQIQRSVGQIWAGPMLLAPVCFDFGPVMFFLGKSVKLN